MERKTSSPGDRQYGQSIRLYKKLREEDKEVEFYLVENAKHGDPAFWTEKNMDIVEKFLKAHMN